MQSNGIFSLHDVYFRGDESIITVESLEEPNFKDPNVNFQNSLYWLIEDLQVQGTPECRSSELLNDLVKPLFSADKRLTQEQYNCLIQILSQNATDIIHQTLQDFRTNNRQNLILHSDETNRSLMFESIESALGADVYPFHRFLYSSNIYMFSFLLQNTLFWISRNCLFDPATHKPRAPPYPVYSILDFSFNSDGEPILNQTARIYFVNSQHDIFKLFANQTYAIFCPSNQPISCPLVILRFLRDLSAAKSLEEIEDILKKT